MSKDSWLLNFGFGPGIHFYSGYTAGFGPGFQVAFEKGMWQLGPGVLTLGAEVGMSYFSYTNTYYGYYIGEVFHPDVSYTYRWFSFIMAARCAYHYGWKIPGLDTYGGVAAGMRFLSFSSTYSDTMDITDTTIPVLFIHSEVFLWGPLTSLIISSESMQNWVITSIMPR
jgi:hypothetical protein